MKIEFRGGRPLDQNEVKKIEKALVKIEAALKTSKNEVPRQPKRRTRVFQTNGQDQSARGRNPQTF